ncbi:DUF7146 domain-containing protein [Methylocapsa aurea]|uniref:DUF7146 domain-containing protein n=1 Tax=Methylocapsa aurea TaxID=663610 RepID=UPI00056BDBB5|nr:hypothetical protein [Methylocapsa aurea]
MRAHDPAFEDWLSRARAFTVRGELERRGLWSRAMLGDAGVPCPRCGGADRFAVNLRKDVWHCRASGMGGDAIALAEYLDGSNFLVAVETILGEPPPGRGSTESDDARRMREYAVDMARADRHRREQDDADSARRFRERERRAAWQLWTAAAPIAGTPAEAYLSLRGVEAPPGARLRFHPAAPLWDRPKDQGGKIIHSGAAILAAIEGANGKFSGVQRLWIDLDQPKGKALIVHPETGEILPAKKTRGSVKGGSILLVKGGFDSDFPGDRAGVRRLFLGEGIETVLSVFCALKASRSKLLQGAEFRTSIDLGNLAGKAVARVRHPTRTQTDRLGRVRPVFVPNSEPKDDPDFPLIPIAESVEDLWLLGDGDSEPVFTRLALERAGKRFSRAHPHLMIRLSMAKPGADFNDMWLAMKSGGAAA